MASKVALILGYGARVGADVARSFASKGYKIAVVSRSDKHPSATPDYLYLQADLSDPFSVQGVFTEVKKQLGAPSVVVYNAGADTVKQAEPLDEDILAFQSDFNVNTVSAWVAARLAIGSFISLGEDVSGTFIYTGNKLNFIIVPPLLSNGVGKSATAHIIKYAAEKFKDTNHKYYYADEREADGSPVYSAIDGPAHGEFYTQLAEGKTQRPWLATFVKGRGYVDFHEAVAQNPGTLPAPSVPA